MPLTTYDQLYLSLTESASSQWEGEHLVINRYHIHMTGELSLTFVIPGIRTDQIRTVWSFPLGRLQKLVEIYVKIEGFLYDNNDCRTSEAVWVLIFIITQWSCARSAVEKNFIFLHIDAKAWGAPWDYRWYRFLWLSTNVSSGSDFFHEAGLNIFYFLRKSGICILMPDCSLIVI